MPLRLLFPLLVVITSSECGAGRTQSDSDSDTSLTGNYGDSLSSDYIGKSSQKKPAMLNHDHFDALRLETEAGLKCCWQAHTNINTFPLHACSRCFPSSITAPKSLSIGCSQLYVKRNSQAVSLTNKASNSSAKRRVLDSSDLLTHSLVLPSHVHHFLAAAPGRSPFLKARSDGKELLLYSYSEEANQNKPTYVFYEVKSRDEWLDVMQARWCKSTYFLMTSCWEFLHFMWIWTHHILKRG